MQEKIKQFLAAEAFAVIGVSSNRNKFGNKVLRSYLQHNLPVYPVNSNVNQIEGVATVKKIAELPAAVSSLSIITPPAITERLVLEAIAHGIRNIWMQPGAQSQAAIVSCEQNGINVIAGGPCILVELGFKEEA